MNLLDLRPVVAADAEEADGRIVILRPRPVTSGFRFPLDWLIYLLAPRKLKLDEVGSFCWRRMDGQRTAGELAATLRRTFGDAVEPAEERLGQFIRMLQREELVRFPELDER